MNSAPGVRLRRVLADAPIDAVRALVGERTANLIGLIVDNEDALRDVVVETLDLDEVLSDPESRGHLIGLLDLAKQE